MENIFGRKKEQETLKNCFESHEAELIAVYGRRRVGKTFLVRNYCDDNFDFYATGIYEGTKNEQLAVFHKQLCDYSKTPYPTVDNWFDAFDQLKHYISTLDKEKIIIFLDELPWFDTARSRFLKAFELFWNSYASARPNIKLIICGSATTWMISNIFGSKGGLYNRVTRKIKLSMFNLYETETYLKSRGIVWSRYQISEAYMIFGGVPYYLKMLQKGRSLAQNVDDIMFSENAELKDEYKFLFRSLFKDSTLYEKIIGLLETKSNGLTRSEIIKSLNINDGGSLTKVLNDLCDCDFVRKYKPFEKKERDTIFQLTDFFTLFHHKFIADGKHNDEHLWTNMVDSSERRVWSGYAFEQLCLHHISQIKNKLGISGVLTDTFSWYCPKNDEYDGGQIDLVIDRRDQVINLCEMKYSINEYTITKKYSDEMIDRMELFRMKTKTRKALHLTMVTTYGLKNNAYSSAIQNDVTLDDLFIDC
ncbi:MAG: AAA family ATPase [Bacteroidales bacterium]|nr:AAA family ATPase [Bacteroidales bacterium]